MMKRCPRGSVLDAETGECVEKSEYNRRWRERNPEKVKGYQNKIRKNLEKKKKKKERLKAYRSRPEVKKQMKEYYEKPEVKQRYKEYYERPEVKERIKQYQKGYMMKPESIERKREYAKRPDVRRKAKERMISAIINECNVGGEDAQMIYNARIEIRHLSDTDAQHWYDDLVLEEGEGFTRMVFGEQIIKYKHIEPFMGRRGEEQ